MKRLLLAVVLLLPATAYGQNNTLESLDSNAPQTHAEMWAGFNPLAEPLDVEVIQAWEQDNIVMMIMRYRVGTFKGKKAMVAAIYGYPKDGDSYPGLVNIHGGGQYADYKAVLTNAMRGYATISIAWAGRLSAPNYRVSPNEVKLFWDGKVDDPNYKVTTDWGSLDAYHAPSKNGQDAFVTIRDGSEDWTLDNTKSPRNSSWFLCAMAARRALTFLQQHPKADKDRLGVYGHSMGGKLTVMTAGSDDRVKAAAPSCGGISDRYNKDPLHQRTVGDSPSLKNTNCPTMILSPANDFHGHINDLVISTNELQTDWRVTCSPHLNHVDIPQHEVATQLWFDQYLKGAFKWPQTPKTNLELKQNGGVPVFRVAPDLSRQILDVEVYYTQQGHLGGGGQYHENRIARYWHYAKPVKTGDAWSANLPVFSNSMPLWVYANVTYKLDKPISGAGYYYGDYTTDCFTLSSLVKLVDAEQLQSAGVKPTLTPSMQIEDFAQDWRKQWFTRQPEKWSIKTHKVYHPMYAAPAGASLALDVYSESPNQLVVGIDQFAAEVAIDGKGWQAISLEPDDFKDAEENALESWAEIKELRLVDIDRLRVRGKQKTRVAGGPWQGNAPQFRNLRWAK